MIMLNLNHQKLWTSISRQTGIWLFGFVVLFACNIIVEGIILPLLDLHETTQNDLYFKCFWGVVLCWLVLGHFILQSFKNHKAGILE